MFGGKMISGGWDYQPPECKRRGHHAAVGVGGAACSAAADNFAGGEQVRDGGTVGADHAQFAVDGEPGERLELGRCQAHGVVRAFGELHGAVFAAERVGHAIGQGAIVGADGSR